MKKALLVVSFGSTVPSAMHTIEAVEGVLRSACPDRDFFRAFSSPTVRKRLKERGLSVPAPDEALEQLCAAGYEDVLLQPTHVIPGFEYDKICALAEPYRERFPVFTQGTPLVSDAEELVSMAEALLEAYPRPEEDEALLFMGHGTEHLANFIFPALQTALQTRGAERCVTATVEGWPSLEDAVGEMKRAGIRRVTLIPFLMVAGEHVRSDMQGEQESSWKNVLLREGFEVSCILNGIGELPAVLAMYRKKVSEE